MCYQKAQINKNKHFFSFSIKSLLLSLFSQLIGLPKVQKVTKNLQIIIKPIK